MGSQKNQAPNEKIREFSKGRDKLEIRNISDIEFEITIIMMLDSMRKDVETMKNDQSEIKNYIVVMRTHWKG